MALSGLIKDFGLGDIFQLVGIQRKTGLLTLEAGGEAVTIKFLDGQVVGADLRSQSVEDLLGAVLVRTSRITEEELARALKIQKKTLQRLGYVLVEAGYISTDELIDALRVQSLQIVYRLFRWRDGEFRFHSADVMDYDSAHFTPISAETILMEGARMIDEWPIIERRIRSKQMVLRPTEAASGLEFESAAPESDADFEFDFGGGIDRPEAAPESKSSDKAKLSEDEAQVFRLVDGKRTVEQITDGSSLGEFDTQRILADLMTRSLLEEVKRIAAPVASSKAREFMDRGVRVGFVALVVLLALGGLANVGRSAVAPWALAAGDPSTARLRLYGSQVRLERLEKAVQVFYLDAGSFPRQLPVLAANGYVDREDLSDPWGRDYGYEVSAGGYRLFGLGPDGEAAPELSISHRFNGIQRMMGKDAASGPSD